jgi:hypothetical protein
MCDQYLMDFKILMTDVRCKLMILDLPVDCRMLSITLNWISSSSSAKAQFAQHSSSKSVG